MNKLFIAGLSMEIGGAERALLGLLHHLDAAEFDVDLFLNRHEGEFMPRIPGWINLLPQERHYASLAVPAAAVLRSGSLAVLAGRAYAKLKAKQYKASHPSEKPGAVELEYSHKYTVPFMPLMSDKEYDLAISFCAPHYFVARKVRAKKKIAWIHTDYSKINIDVASEMMMWDQYDHIVSISDAVTRSFLCVFPGLASKIIKIENMLVPSMIQEDAHAFDVSGEMPEDSSVRILSIGRYCTAKNFDNVPDICSRLRKMGLNVKWYLIGFGGDEELIRRKIREASMEQHVVMLGKKENPYPYIRACDLYVQPSRYEGKCVTVREAQMLGKPVVITRYATASSQLEEDVDGVIVPMDNEGCAQGIAALLRNPEKMAHLSAVCLSREYANRNETQMLVDCLKE